MFLWCKVQSAQIPDTWLGCWSLCSHLIVCVDFFLSNSNPSPKLEVDFTLKKCMIPHTHTHPPIYNLNPTPLILHCQSYTLHSPLCIIQLSALQYRSEFDVEEPFLFLYIYVHFCLERFGSHQSF
jgi:hypothetical protein